MKQVRNLIAILFILLVGSFIDGTAQDSGNALELGVGSKSYIDAGDVDDVENTDQLTIAVWVKFYSLSKNKKGENIIPLASKWYSGDGKHSRNSFLFCVRGGKLQFFTFSPDPKKAMSGSCQYNLQSMQWYHLAFVFDRGTVTLYVDGKSIYSKKGDFRSLNNSTEPFRIGAWYHMYKGKYSSFKGLLDEFQVWRRALTPREIDNIRYQKLLGDEKDLVIYYDFDDKASGALAKDISGHGHHAYFKSGAKRVSFNAPVNPPQLAALNVSSEYADGNGNDVLDAGESAEIIVNVTNVGKGKAKNVVIKCTPSENSSEGIDLGKNLINIGDLVPGKSESRIIAIKADNELIQDNLSIDVQAYTSDNIKSRLVQTKIPTQEKLVAPPFPAFLTLESVEFREQSGNKALDGYETGEIALVITNAGGGKAQNVNLILSPLQSDKNLVYEKNIIIESIDKKSSHSVSIPIFAEGTIETSKRSIRIQANEEFGFDADPIVLNVETLAFNPPDLMIDKIAINDSEDGDAYGNGNSIIDPNESIVVSAFVQNLGAGVANDVKATVILESSDRNISCPDQGQEIELGNISPGDYKPVEFYFYTSKRYSKQDIPLKIQLTESRGDFGKKIDLGLKMKIHTPNIIDINITKIAIPKPTIKAIKGFTRSDIDSVAQTSKTSRINSLAVIIGIENYKYTSSASFASRDAGAFYQYATKILGIPNANVYYLVDDGATAGEFNKLFDENGWLSKRVTENSDIFVFYSGHGAPDIKSKTPYILPYDIDPNYAQNGYSSYQLYKNLSELNAKSVTVMLDACFSGQNKENEMLFADARPALLSVEPSSVPSNVTLISASSADQISSGYPAEKHGIFSYYLMKGMSTESDVDKNGKITLGELYDYLYENVKSTAGRLDREQTPELINGNRDQIIVQY